MGQFFTKVEYLISNTIVVLVNIILEHVALSRARWLARQDYAEIQLDPSPSASPPSPVVLTPETSPEERPDAFPPRSPPRSRSASTSPKKRPSPVKTDLAAPRGSNTAPKTTPEDQIINTPPAALGALAPGGASRDIGEIIAISRRMNGRWSFSSESARQWPNRSSSWGGLWRNEPRPHVIDKDFEVDARRHLGLDVGDRSDDEMGESGGRSNAGAEMSIEKKER